MRKKKNALEFYQERVSKLARVRKEKNGEKTEQMV